MRGRPDLIVRTEGTPRISLIAKVRLHLDERELGEVESELKRYMLDNLIAVGLIVTPSKTHILVDSFDSFDEGSVRDTGEFNTVDLLGMDDEPTTEGELHDALQRWLEQLTTGSPQILPHAEAARSALFRDVVPAVADRQVGSGSLG